MTVLLGSLASTMTFERRCFDHKATTNKPRPLNYCMVSPSKASTGIPGTRARSKALLLVLIAIFGIAGLFSLLSSSSNPTTESQTSTSQQSSIRSTTTTEKLKKMGFTKTVIKEGSGEKPAKGQYVTVHCTGMGKDRDLSKKFWSTKDPGNINKG